MENQQSNANELSQVFVLFLAFTSCGNPMHLAYRIEGTNALDVVGYYYLFGSLNVRVQYNQ